MPTSAPLFDYGQAGQGVGGLFGAAASVLGGIAGVRAADENQAMLAKSADYDLLRGKLQMADVDRQAKEVIDAQKVSYAAQGVDLASETVSQVREETYMESTRVKNEIELSAAMDAWGKREQGRIQSNQARANARGARIGAAGQVVGSIAQIGGAFA